MTTRKPTHKQKVIFVRNRLNKCVITVVMVETGFHYQTLADIRDDKPGKTTQRAVINRLYDYFKN